MRRERVVLACPCLSDAVFAYLSLPLLLYESTLQPSPWDLLILGLLRRDECDGVLARPLTMKV